MFVVISVIYRPIEQLLSRTIAERRARGHKHHPLGIPIAIQASFALLFLAVALALHEPLVDKVFDGYSALYDVLIVGTLAYAASYFARGWLAGHEYFALFGGLVLMESISRICFVIAAALGITSGQTAVALGIAAAPLVSLVVVPLAFARRGGEHHEHEGFRYRSDRGDRSRANQRADNRGRGGRSVGRTRYGGSSGGGSPRRALAPAGHGFCRLGVGDHALRADDPERRRTDRGGDLARQSARGHRVQRAADRTRAAAAVPGDSDLAAAPSDGPRGDGWPRGLRPRDPCDGTGDRRLRRSGGLRAAR